MAAFPATGHWRSGNIPGRAGRQSLARAARSSCRLTTAPVRLGADSQRMSLHPPFREAAEAWLSEDPDPKTAAALRALIARADTGDAKAQRALHERFAGQLEFGTAGLRGILGPGPQKLTRVLVRKEPAGLGANLRANVPDVATRGGLIGHDSRHH